MKKFRQKTYTIQEGHYTGSKDLDKIPSLLNTVVSTAITGAGIGGVNAKMFKNKAVIDGALEGSKWGSLGGVGLKILLNYIHKPMKSVKYQELDRTIRERFGIIRVSGITVGDTLNKRAEIEERFAFCDGDVTKYKINIAIQDNKVTLYTLDLTNKELSKLSSSLDYYCKKYFGMDYTSISLNPKLNSYAVSVTFTNYQILVDFIMEISKLLNTKINIINDKGIVDRKLEAGEGKKETKSFSFFSKDKDQLALSKSNLIVLLGSSATSALSNAYTNLGGGKKAALSAALMGSIIAGIKKLSSIERSKLGVPTDKSEFNNDYLASIFKKLHYIKDHNYTVGKNDSGTAQISLLSGKLLLTVNEKSPDVKVLDEKFWTPLKSTVTRVNSGGVILYTFTSTDKQKYEFTINKLMSTGIKVNIFE